MRCIEDHLSNLQYTLKSFSNFSLTFANIRSEGLLKAIDGQLNLILIDIILLNLILIDIILRIYYIEHVATS
ncbi:hypothetical protein GD3902_00975 [Geobacillus thermodenitrificans]|nr:hypothetical protein GD3902_00975 [Geobacillus thermodenitrificans]